ncbi:hypothetical protein ACP70R_033200 [Stipagrostis hirtigluma subsp. patula]
MAATGRAPPLLPATAGPLAPYAAVAPSAAPPRASTAADATTTGEQPSGGGCDGAVAGAASSHPPLFLDFSYGDCGVGRKRQREADAAAMEPQLFLLQPQVLPLATRLAG